jgi:hypothetical protein
VRTRFIGEWSEREPAAFRRQSSRREDEAVRRSATTCVVFQLSNRDDSQDDPDGAFICPRCEADAKQLFEIQDSIWPGISEAGQSSEQPDNPAPC